MKHYKIIKTLNYAKLTEKNRTEQTFYFRTYTKCIVTIQYI